MKTHKLLHLLLLLSLVMPLTAHDQTCRFLGSMLLINKFDNCSDISYPQSDMFYLKLGMAPKALDLEECRSINSMNYTTTLGDMCASRKRNKTITESLMSVTCPSYRNVYVSGPLGICKEVFNSLGYCVTLESYNETVTTNETFLYNKSSLNETVNRIQTTLGKYFQVIDRTLVGSFFKDRGQRCLCLDSYKKWLCSSSLNLFHESDNSSCSSKQVTDSPASKTLLLTKPCLSVCQRVVQSCPYYLPSSFQIDVTSNDTKEVVYGGYPAFDCPRPNTLTKLYSCNGTCGTCNGTCDTCTYACPGCPCLGYSSGAALSIHRLPLRTTFVWTLSLVAYCIFLVS